MIDHNQEKFILMGAGGHGAVVAEAIQSVLRREGFEKPYELLKDLTRTNEGITQNSVHLFIDTLKVSDLIKEELKAITPHNYT